MKARDYHQQIKDLIIQGKTNPEIAEEIGISRGSIAIFVQRELGGNPNYLKKITKHKHLHKKILEMRLNLSDEKIRFKLNLSKGEMKSCMSSAYKDESLRYLRVDTRRRDSWSAKELRFLLKYSGIISRKEINQYLGRGKNEIVIKEKLQKLGLCSKNVNGLTYSQFTKLFKKDPLYFLETSAGSPSSPFCRGTHFLIIPWCHIDEMLKARHIVHSESVQVYIEAMAVFQVWIHGKDYWRSLTRRPNFKKE